MDAAGGADELGEGLLARHEAVRYGLKAVLSPRVPPRQKAFSELAITAVLRLRLE